MACIPNMVLLPEVVSERCLRVQILLETDFCQSKLVPCRLAHGGTGSRKKLSSETCPGFALKRAGPEQRLATGQQLPSVGGRSFISPVLSLAPPY